MGYDEGLKIRLNNLLEDKKVDYQLKNMMGGLTYMVNGKMCLGIVEERLMARIDPEIYEDVLIEDGVQEMDFTGRPMKGYVFVEPSAHSDDTVLEKWIDRCLEFNPKAKSSKRR